MPVHPYAAHPFGGNLDELILNSVRERLQTCRKPVLIGECGLDWAPPRGTLDVASRAEVGIRHAIWASVVSGAMSGRMLWWQDGWDQFEKADVCRHYEQAAAPVAAFVKGIDFTDFAPVGCEAPGLKGAVLGNDHRLIGWFRDARCVPLQWALREVSGQEVTLGGHRWTRSRPRSAPAPLRCIAWGSFPLCLLPPSRRFAVGPRSRDLVKNRYATLAYPGYGHRGAHGGLPLVVARQSGESARRGDPGGREAVRRGSRPGQGRRLARKQVRSARPRELRRDRLDAGEPVGGAGMGCRRRLARLSA